jgi:CRISPR type III-A-associated RAMP protein Csm5
MDELFKTAVVELETVSPLFIKGKDIDYGEGMLKGKDKDGKDCVFLIDNDKLCEYIADKGKVEEYVQYFVRDEDTDVLDGFAKFHRLTVSPHNLRDFAPDANKKPNIVVQRNGINYPIVEWKLKIFLGKINNSYRNGYEQYKKLSLQYFLEVCNILPKSYEEFKRIAKGITLLPDESGGIKPFVKNALNKPFIPGSSIKGAIRNAVLWKIMSDPAKKQWLNDFVRTNLSNPNKKKLKEKFSTEFSYAGKNVPQQSFISPADDFKGEYRQQWQNANETLRDFFRIVKISDANFTCEIAPERERTATVCANGNQTSRKKHELELECVPEGSKAQFRITIDQKMAERFFGTIPDYLKNVHNLLQTVHEFFEAVWNFEKNFFNGKKPVSSSEFKADTSEIYSFYSDDVSSYQKVCFTLDEIAMLVKKFPELDKLQLPIVQKGDNFIISIDDISEQDKNDLISIGFFREILQRRKYLFRTGWGGGMMSKTQFLHLSNAHRQEVRNLITKRGTQTAPKSRCLAIENEGSDKAVSPLGWCSLKILKHGELPSIEKAGFTSTPKPSIEKPRFKNHGPTRKHPAPEPPKKTLVAYKHKHKHKKLKDVKKSGYQVGQELKKIQWNREGDVYKVKIKDQEEWAVLTGKNKPYPYQQIINCVVTEIVDGVVTKVKGK